MLDEVSLQFLPLQPHEFEGLPAGFEYEHEISEDFNTTAFNTGVDTRDLRRCVEALFLLSLKVWSTSRETASIYVICIMQTLIATAFS